MRVCLALMMAVVMGCQAGRAPAAGMASLRVKVVAEPKVGVKMASNPLRVYDVPVVAQSQEKGDFERVDYSHLDDVAVWVEGVNGKAPGREVYVAAVKVRDQAASADALQLAAVGAFLHVTNVGEKSINVYSVSDGNEFDLGMLKPGQMGECVPKSAGLIEVLTDSVKEPIARVYVTPTQWQALTRSGQTVTFRNLPPGEYRVKSWHPRLPGGETVVKVAADQTAMTVVKVGVNGLPKVGSR